MATFERYFLADPETHHEEKGYYYRLRNDEAVVDRILDAFGVEPLTPAFDGTHLFKRSRGKTVNVKCFLMDNAVVAGIGNIYATETLFAANISPLRPAGKLNLLLF